MDRAPLDEQLLEEPAARDEEDEGARSGDEAVDLRDFIEFAVHSVKIEVGPPVRLRR